MYLCCGHLQTHVNPCFVQSSLTDDPQPLQRDSWFSLQDGDLFSLLPGQLIYRVVAVGDGCSSRYLHLISIMCPHLSSLWRPKSNKLVLLLLMECGGGRWVVVVVWLIREEDDWCHLCSLLIFNVGVGFHCPRARGLNFRSNSRRALEHVCPSSEEMHLNQKQCAGHHIWSTLHVYYYNNLKYYYYYY